MNATVTTTTVSQTGNSLLGTPNKTIYYVIIEKNGKKAIINIGEKTYNEIKKTLEQELQETEQKQITKEKLK